MQAKRGAKNLERMEEHVPDFKYQSVHNTISHSPWAYRPLMDEIALRADGLLGGGPRARLVIDDTGFAKKGNCSVGVARQYIGRVGKIDNGQVAVCTSLASGQMSTTTDIRLYMPESWCDDPQRCEKAGVPEEFQKFATKTEIARQSVKHQREIGVRFDVLSMDSGYGSDHGFLHHLDEDEETFVAEVHCDQRVWIEAPWPHREGKRKAKQLQHPVASSPSQRVDALAEAMSEGAWRRLEALENQGQRPRLG